MKWTVTTRGSSRGHGIGTLLLSLSACLGVGADDSCGKFDETCTWEGGTCGDGTGPACDPSDHHVDYTLSCRPTVGASGKLGAVCCVPGAGDAGDAGDAAIE
jgi:hypothetical protein